MSRADSRRFLIAYDVPDDRRRTKVAKCLEAYGDRIQYSVFVTDISPARMVRLKSEITALLVLDEDSVLLCDLGKLSSLDSAIFSFIGRDRPITDNTAIIV